MPSLGATDGFVTANGLRLHYLDWGEAGRPPMVCLHGSTGQAGTWGGFARAMRSEHRVLALDQRGHGDSQWAAGGYPRSGYVEDLAAFLDVVGLSRVTLVGLSLGGIVALLFAGAYPERVGGLVLVDIGPEPGASAARRGVQPRRWSGYPLEFASLDEAVAWARQDYLWALGDGLRDDLAGRMRRRADGTWAWKADPAWFNAPRPGEGAPAERDALWDALRAVQCPVLEVRGAESGLVSDEVLDRMRRANPRLSAVDAPGAGHNVVVDAPAALLEAVRTFLAGASPGRG